MRQPWSLSATAMVPPCSWATQREMARPRPVPLLWAALVVNRSKTARRSAGGDAGSVVGDGEPGRRSPCRLGAHPDQAAGGAVPGRVVEQVGEQLVQAVGVGRDGEGSGRGPTTA